MASSTQGSPQCAIVSRRSRKWRPGRVQQRRAGVLHPGVDPGRAGLVHHDRDAQLLRLLEDRERDHRVGGGPVLVHRVQLEAGQAQVPHGPFQFPDRRRRPAVGRVHRRVADERVRPGRGDRGDVVVALLRGRRPGYPGDAVRVHGADQLAASELRGHGQDHDLVEAWVVADRLVRPDDREALAAVPAGLPLLLGRRPVRRQQAEAAVDAQRALTPVLGGELRVLGEAQDVRVRVDLHRLCPIGRVIQTVCQRSCPP